MQTVKTISISIPLGVERGGEGWREGGREKRRGGEKEGVGGREEEGREGREEEKERGREQGGERERESREERERACLRSMHSGLSITGLYGCADSQGCILEPLHRLNYHFSSIAHSWKAAYRHPAW